MSTNSELLAEIARLRGELQWIADTPLKWSKPQNDVYWSNVAVAMAKKAMDALAPQNIPQEEKQ